MSKETKSSPPWGIVILLVIVFWPVGLYLLFKKLSTGRGDNLGEGKGLRTTGIIFIVFAVIYFSMAGSSFADLENGESTVEALSVVGTVFGVGGVIMIISANRKRSRSNKYKKYIAIVTDNKVRKIDSIANAFPTTYEKAHNDLIEMINKGFFEGAYIDESKREIIYANSITDDLAAQLLENLQQYTQSQLTKQQPFTEQKEPPKKKEPRIVICKNCGGNNKIIDGDIGECEYCGSPIE